MNEYTVQINQLPLGILLNAPSMGHSKFVSIIGVANYSYGARLGLCIGDVLIAINGRSTFDLSPFEALQLFNQQKPPFSATFRTFTNHIPLTRIQTDMKPEWNVHGNKTRKILNSTAISPQLSTTEACDIDDELDIYSADIDADTPDIPFFDDVSSNAGYVSPGI